ncbi:hypothetical protein Scep_024157 [Stephania cephalantha]|uniref:Uncharacterized protein n=1 Tax=Stephania cephalantha TaxID=152367 RepID=A0AAP0F1G4_9MAGN
MIIRLAPNLVDENRRVEAEGGTPRIKFDSNANNPSGNVSEAQGSRLRERFQLIHLGLIVLATNVCHKYVAQNTKYVAELHQQQRGFKPGIALSGIVDAIVVVSHVRTINLRPVIPSIVRLNRRH